MRKIILLIFVLLVPLSLLAQVSSAASPTPTPMAPVNSYELFWPITAGKTRGDSLYGLKLFKEKVRGFFIFGKPQKADYAIFLATKRAVEAEKLIKEGKNSLGEKTLENMLVQLKIASENLAAAGNLSKEKVDKINLSLGKLEIFFDWLATKSEPLKDKIQLVLKEVKKINSEI